jgi:hypothetical protein
MVPENLLVFCWRVIDDIHDRPVGNPREGVMNIAASFPSVMKPRYVNPVENAKLQKVMLASFTTALDNL